MISSVARKVTAPTISPAEMMGAAASARLSTPSMGRSEAPSSAEKVLRLSSRSSSAGKCGVRHIPFLYARNGDNVVAVENDSGRAAQPRDDLASLSGVFKFVYGAVFLKMTSLSGPV